MRVTSPRLSSQISPFTASASACSGTASHCPSVSTPSAAPVFSEKNSAVRMMPWRAPPTGAMSERDAPPYSLGSFA